MPRSYYWVGRAGKLRKYIKRDKYLLLLILPVVVYYAVFQYAPMYGIIMALKDFSIKKGILGSEWVGIKWFDRFFHSLYFWPLLRNTLSLSLLGLMFGSPAPVLFAMLLNECCFPRSKRLIQTLSYLPHFISLVIMITIMNFMFSPNFDIINTIIKATGNPPVYFMSDARWILTMYTASGIWQGFGWSAIIYLATLSGIDPSLYEAAVVDGAGRWRQVWYISIPGILPTLIILQIMSVGNLMSVGFEKVNVMMLATWPSEQGYTVWNYRRLESYDEGRTWEKPVPIRLLEGKGLSASFGDVLHTRDGRLLVCGTFFQKRTHPLRGSTYDLARAKNEDMALAITDEDDRNIWHFFRTHGLRRQALL